MKNNQINRVLGSMNSFKEAKYQRNEVLPELLKLQSEMVQLTFGDREDAADLKIYDVAAELKRRNEMSGNAAGAEFERLDFEMFQLGNEIRALISGNKGEAKAFYALLGIHNPKIILQNVELEENGIHTELDAVVITPKVAAIIEVKNTRGNVLISEDGVYYRVGETLKKDSDIAEKMQLRERFLKNLLARNGITDVPVHSILVFTNDYIEVRNKCPEIKTCFVNLLADTVENLETKETMDREKRKEIEDLVREATKVNAYKMRFNADQLKVDFATVLVKLEEAETANETAHRGWWKKMKNNFHERLAKLFRTA